MNKISVDAQSRDWLWLLLIIFTGLALRTAVVVGFNHVPQSDELAYKSMALNLIYNNKVVDHMGNHAMYNAGYPLFILAPVFFLFGEDIYAARIFNVILGGVAIVLVYLVSKEAGAGRMGRLLAASIWAAYLPACIYVVYLLKENLMVPLMLGVIWCALRLVKQPSARVATGCGVLLGLLALTGNAALSLGIAVILALALTPATRFQRVTLVTLIPIVALIIASPWMIRNMHVLGAPVLNTNAGFNLYLGNNPRATGMFVSISDTPRGPTWEALRKKGEVQASEILKQEAITWAREHPTEFLILALKKAAYFWTPPFHKGKGEESTAEMIARVLWLIQFVAIVSAALAGILIRNLRNRETAILWIAVAGYTAVHMLFYVIFRYRVPIMPLVCVLAALSVESLISVKKNLHNPPPVG